MFWNWISATARRELTLRAGRITESIRAAFDDARIHRAPQALLDELVEATRQLAAVAPRDLANAIARAEDVLERLHPFLCTGCDACPHASAKSVGADRAEG